MLIVGKWKMHLDKASFFFLLFLKDNKQFHIDSYDKITFVTCSLIEEMTFCNFNNIPKEWISKQGNVFSCQARYVS